MRLFKRNADIEATAEALYDPGLPYHNFAHALDATHAAEAIIKRCCEENVEVKAEVVYYALLFHDAGYREDPIQYGCATKEDYSVKLATQVLEQFGINAETTEMVAAAIRATHRDATFRTTEEKVVRAADLAGLAADYPVFLQNSERLKAEWEYLHGQSISWRDWLPEAQHIIRFFLSQDIRLTRYYTDADGSSAFHRRTEANLRRLYEDKIGQAP